MNLDRIVLWYQKSITKYDKLKWEESGVQRSSNGFVPADLKGTKIKPELIDVDLVRGSSFPKAKPKRTLYVLRSAVERLMFLPFYSKWWIEQTSRNTFRVLFYLYILQLINWGIYILSIAYSETKHIVTISDVVVPNLLSLLLSIIHSQIVAAAGISTSNDRNLNTHGRMRENGLRTRKLRRVSNNVSSNENENENTPIIGYEDNQECYNRSNWNVGQYSDTKCPIGLRKRNRDWNHIYSPYWIDNVNVKQSTTHQSENSKNCDECVARNDSNIDDGFESFIGKTSNSKDSTPLQQSKVKSAVDKYSNEENLNAMLNNSTDVENDIDFLSPNTNLHPIDDITSPLIGSECNYSSEDETHIENSSNVHSKNFPPVSSSITDKITCTFFLENETKKEEMSAVDILSVITKKVEATSDSCDYVYVGVLFSLLLAMFPVVCRLYESALNSIDYAPPNILNDDVGIETNFISFGNIIWESLVLTNGLVLRFSLTFMLFFLLAVAERTFKQRLLYAKIFSHLTSARRAKKSQVPHFRLSKLRNIKMWLNVRSYFKERGPQRSVDIIVSAAFILNLAFVSFLCAESLNDSVQQHWQYNLEALLWSCSLGCFILRFMTLGTEINEKYRSVSILITEQINLYVKIEQNPEKKQELLMSSSVLKLATDLLKELESPFKISGVIANPYLSAIVRVVIVSALSGVGSEILGFKLKLFKTKEI